LPATATAGPGSRGNETSYFGLATQNAVTRFQKAYQIGDATSYGLVGPMTRAKLNELYGNTTQSSLLSLPGIQLTEEQRTTLERVLGIAR
jgi:peptidoglycan hydrolase-like protein with peptidoglycan-binding domain